MSIIDLRKENKEFHTALCKVAKILKKKFYPDAAYFKIDINDYFCGESNGIEIIFIYLSKCGCCSNDEYQMFVLDTIVYDGEIELFIKEIEDKRISDKKIKAERKKLEQKESDKKQEENEKKILKELQEKYKDSL